MNKNILATILGIASLSLFNKRKRALGSANYNVNGLQFWYEDEIKLREKFVEDIVDIIKEKLRPIKVIQVEAPVLTPDSKIYEGYKKDRMYSTSDHLTLRPQTTMGSYSFAQTMLKRGEKPPFVIWQHGKSFRREQNKTKKHMRLKEFYQLEFQIFYDEALPHPKINAKKLIKEVKNEIQDYIGRCRVVDAKPPHYAEWTKDIERSKNSVEIASISERNDFKGPSDDINIKVLEIAIGTDRVVFNHFDWKNK